MMEISQLSRAALKVALPLLAIGGAVIAARRNGGDPREVLALRSPPLLAATAWLAVYLALIQIGRAHV